MSQRATRNQRKQLEETEESSDSEQCTTLATQFDWASLAISEELVTFGKSLQQLAATAPADLAKITKAQLLQQLSDLSKSYIHAVSQEQGPREEGHDDARKDEARVANRAANAEAAAKTKGKSQTDTASAVAEAIATEREKLAAKAKAEAEAAQANLEAAERLRVQAAADAQTAAAAHRQELASKQAELQATRARVKAAEDAAEQLKRSRDQPAEAAEAAGAAGSSSGGAPAPKKRKTVAEVKREFIEDKGEAAWEDHVAAKQLAAQKKAQEKQEELKKQALVEVESKMGKRLERLELLVESYKSDNQKLEADQKHIEALKRSDDVKFNRTKNKQKRAEHRLRLMESLCKEAGVAPQRIKEAASADLPAAASAAM